MDGPLTLLGAVASCAGCAAAPNTLTIAVGLMAVGARGSAVLTQFLVESVVMTAA